MLWIQILRLSANTYFRHADGAVMSVPAPQGETASLDLSALIDRRREERLTVCVPVRIVYVSGRRTSYEGTCTNVSSTGAGFDINAVLRVGDEIEFEFRNTDDVPVLHTARILYREGKHYGTYFLNY